MRLFGHDMAQLDHAAAVRLRTAHVGVVSQRSGLDLLDDLDCLDNVALQARLARSGRDDGRRAAVATLARLGLDHLARRRPGSLSGGERQRVALAAALAHGPGLVIADEPTSELDAVSADQVYDFLRENAERTGAALLVVTHDERAERIATRVVTIHDGRLSQEMLDGSNSLVVDGRGWVRLPDVLRLSAGVVTRVKAEAIDGRISLVGSEPVRLAAEAVDGESPRVGDLAVSVVGAELDIGSIIIGPVSIELRRGQVTVIKGRSGSGKTSLLSVVLGINQPTRGDVQQHVAAFACAPQTAAFADQQNVAANVDLVRAIRSKSPVDASDDVLESLGLAGLAGRPAGALSGGERQRLAVARALCADADLVVLDEPTSQLDRATARLVAGVVRATANSGACVVCASHDDELIAVADQVLDLGAQHQRSGVPCL